ncbi:MAG: nitronate monooxygenase [Firmicutes bacterium]|nr:nitronate monooxygenase [Bacillota bacterium]
MQLTDLLGCRYPIVQGGLAYVGNGLLAGAISAAGGFGQIGSAGRSLGQLAQELTVARRRANGAPIGVNLPLSEHADREAYVRFIEEHASELRAVSLSAGNPRPYIERLQACGLCVMVLVSTPDQAQKAQSAGADILVAEGYEAGGHNGPSEITTFALIPQVARAVSIPVVAAGGIASGEGIAAALSLGAQGVQMGTRFVATIECEAHDAYKRALIARGSADTRIIERSVGRVTRVLQSPYVERILELESHSPDWETLYPYVRGERNRLAAIEGVTDEGWLNCGQGVGLIEDVVTVEELMQRLVKQATSALRDAQIRGAAFA